MEGNSGFGKTTLAVKLANDWTKRKDYISSKFNLVSRNDPSEKTPKENTEDFIHEIIYRAVKKKSITRVYMKSYASQHNVLLLLNGYGRMTVKSRTSLHDVLEKN